MYFIWTEGRRQSRWWWEFDPPPSTKCPCGLVRGRRIHYLIITGVLSIKEPKWLHGLLRRLKTNIVRYFFFSYTYAIQVSSGTINGAGNLLLGSTSFPSQNYIKKLAAGNLADAIGVDVESIQAVIRLGKSNICITNWIEMTKEDYKAFDGK